MIALDEMGKSVRYPLDRHLCTVGFCDGFLAADFGRRWIERAVLDDELFCRHNVPSPSTSTFTSILYFLPGSWPSVEVVCEGVLAAEQCVDRCEIRRYLAFEGHREMHAARFFGKACPCGSLPAEMSAGPACRVTRPWAEIVASTLIEQIAGADDIDRNTGFLNDLRRISSKLILLNVSMPDATRMIARRFDLTSTIPPYSAYSLFELSSTTESPGRQ